MFIWIRNIDIRIGCRLGKIDEEGEFYILYSGIILPETLNNDIVLFSIKGYTKKSFKMSEKNVWTVHKQAIYCPE